MDFDDMTDQQIVDLVKQAEQALARRQSLAALDKQVGQLLTSARSSGVVKTPDPGAAWVQPTSTVDAYLQGDVVTHQGKTWASTVNFNTWEPGVSGWRLQDAADGTPAEWVRPSGTHDAYAKGDRVTFEGEVWESVWDNPNTWSPTEFADAWQKIG